MNRRFGWAMLLVVGVLVGFASSSYQQSDAGPPMVVAADSDDADDAKAVEQLKEIKTQLKEINALLRSGTLRVVVVINPDAK